MKITDSARNAILHVMEKKGLDRNTTFLEIGVFEGNLGMGFTREKIGRSIKSGDLTLIISSNLDLNGMTVDYGKINDKEGLIFLGENNDSNNDK